jgi:hypothetical protein
VPGNVNPIKGAATGVGKAIDNVLYGAGPAVDRKIKLPDGRLVNLSDLRKDALDIRNRYGLMSKQAKQAEKVYKNLTGEDLK